MKLLSEKRKIYLLLLEKIFPIITVVIAGVFINGKDTDVLENSFIFQTLNLLITSFIYFNVGTLNNDLRIASILKIFKAGVNVIVNLILPNLISFFIFKYIFIDILEFVGILSAIPFAFFFYKGLSDFVLQKSENTTLANKWKKLLVPNIVLSVLGLIIHIKDLYSGSIGLTENEGIAFIVLLISLLALSFTVYLMVIEIIYIFKTANEIK